ncbi:DNA repair protein RadA [candidate division WOR-1 bacterium RIFOXYB2_FULL_46_45]|nr:MAG: DNA repair protein RadA [candidate division WOR-1 bacterium RIFOXYB2_FULL_46_45]
MPKVKSETVFVCGSCGQDFPKWAGQCGSCGEWNTLSEEQIRSTKSETLNKSKTLNSNVQNKPINIKDIKFDAEDRIKTGLDELDRVLGGGIVPGSVVLVGGDPGIGKSTLMLQLANLIKAPVLYVSGEESAKQVRMRAERLKALSPNIKFFPETNIAAIEEAMVDLKPTITIIDSIQTIYREDLTSAAGSVSQVRESGAYLVQLAKSLHIATFVVGHVTKEGNLAGPRILEHMVDTVLYFEGERHRQFRILRGVKNRFGSVHEVGIFEMKKEGLVPVLNPSEVFLSERPVGQPGSVVTAVIEGSRPLLLEIQALVSFTKMAVPRRTTVGLDYNRVSMVAAILENRLNMKLSSEDIYVNVAGGVSIDEPAADLAVAVAIASSYKKKIVPPDTLFVGEVGLTSEVRAVSQIEARVQEAEKLGFKKIIIPKGNAVQVKSSNIRIDTVSNIKDALYAIISA